MINLIAGQLPLFWGTCNNQELANLCWSFANLKHPIATDLLVTHCEFFAKRCADSDLRSLSVIMHSFQELKSPLLDAHSQHQLFASVLVKRRSEIQKANVLDYSTLLLFVCKSDIQENTRALLLESLIPKIPIHMPKIGSKGFGSMCYGLSFLPKD